MNAQMKQAIIHARNAFEYTQQLWDSIREIEKLFDVEIDTDKFLTSPLAIESLLEISDETMKEFIESIIR